ncbi:MAG: MFS transporter [Actinomycetota bacterium]
MTVSLADSIFFSATTHAARPNVLLYLLITMAPFAVVAPVLGPMLDRTRGGRRWLIAAACAGRAALCLLMANAIDDILLYPLAFGSLVLSKGQSVAKSALVPAVVDDQDELVLANSRLSLISIAGAIVAGPIAAAILKLADAEWVLRVGAIVFIFGVVSALAIPRAKVVGRPETEHDRELLHSRSIMIAGTAMGLVRGVVGFTTFFAAFVLKKQGEPAWIFGLVLIGSAIGNAIGTIVAPLVRRKIQEEWILAGSLIVPALPLLIAARSYGRVALIFAAGAIAASAAAARLAFDSLLQRDGADAARGRAFARFETRFQIVWVLGGVFAVIFFGGGRAGIFLVAVALLFGGLSYVGAVRRQAAPREPRPPEKTPGAPRHRRLERRNANRNPRGRIN